MALLDFSECKAALGTAGKLLEQKEKNIVYRVFKEKVPFLPWGIDWKQFNSFHKIDKVEEIYHIDFLPAGRLF